MTTFVVPFSAREEGARTRNFSRVYEHLRTFGEDIHHVGVDLSDDCPARAIANARNRGAFFVADDVIVFNDADSLVEGFQIIRAASLARQEPGLVFAYTRYRRLTKASTEAIVEHGWHANLVESEWESDTSLSSGCVAISVASFNALGGYDETWLDGFEDYDLALRSRERYRNPRHVPGDLLHLWHERPAVEPENGRDLARYKELYG